MADKARRNFTEEFKAETVALLEGSGRPLSQMSRELGIEQSVLRAWRRKLRPTAAASSRPVAPASNCSSAAAASLTADQADASRGSPKTGIRHGHAPVNLRGFNMFIERYSLREHPFRMTPDARLFFASSIHSRAYAHLMYGLAQL